jgi:hypothetical protein
MDSSNIAKYIGLFLSKNSYCSLPGLGTLSLLKTPAKRVGSETVLPPEYKISFNQVGSIDDKFPNFIAMNENISTNNASNLINLFSKTVKEEVANGRPYIIDGLGRFTGTSAKIDFVQISDLDFSDFVQSLPTLPPMPVDNTRSASTDNVVDFKNSYNATPKESSFSIGKVVLPIILLAIIAVGSYFGYNYLNNKNSTNKPEVDTLAMDTTTVKPDTSLVKIDSNKVDSTTQISNGADTTKNKLVTTDTTKPTAPIMNGPAMQIILNTYSSQALADARSKKLAANGNSVSVVKGDSTSYHVVLNLAATNRPADVVVDSIRRFFNPSNKNGTVRQLK